MSWDVVILNLSKPVTDMEEVDESLLVDIGTGHEFKALMEKRYPDIKWRDDFGVIERNGFSIEFSVGDLNETFSNAMFHLYGEDAIYEVIELCKANKWHVYDSGLGEILDLENPGNNGYENHKDYVQQILNNRQQ